MAEPVPGRKRSRMSNSPDGDDKKRGRPRVEKQDESAADRRRTQIRMAQRAYRQRKESTLDELRQRVSSLTNTIELMNKNFGDFRDRIFSYNLPQDVMLDVHNVSSQFDSLVKDARNPNDECTNELSTSVHRPSAASSTTETVPETGTEGKNVPSWLDQSAVAQSIRPKTNGVVDQMGYIFEGESKGPTQTARFTTFPPGSQHISPTQLYQQSPQIDPFDAADFQLEDLDTFAIPSELSPPITYSFQETTIARRIHRSCAEAAYQRLLDPLRRPSEYERIFRLSLMGRTREKIIASLRRVLDRGPHEDLNVWEAPLIHVGGAGTHYPRRDQFGNLVGKKTSFNIGLIGPQTLSLLENASRDSLSTDMTVQIAGYEGEWFDSYDVQGYLEEKGIYIEPTTSFAEAEIVEWGPDSSAASTESGQGSAQTAADTQLTRSRHSTPLTSAQVDKMIKEADADFSQWNDFTNMELTAVGYSDALSGSWMNFVQPGHTVNQISQPVQQPDWEGYDLAFLQNNTSAALIQASQPPTPQPRRKSIIIDVSKFVKVMTTSAVCIGRTPGFRRRDVDRALAISSFNAL